MRSGLQKAEVKVSIFYIIEALIFAFTIFLSLKQICNLLVSVLLLHFYTFLDSAINYYTGIVRVGLYYISDLLYVTVACAHRLVVDREWKAAHEAKGLEHADELVVH